MIASLLAAIAYLFFMLFAVEKFYDFRENLYEKKRQKMREKELQDSIDKQNYEDSLRNIQIMGGITAYDRYKQKEHQNAA